MILICGRHSRGERFALPAYAGIAKNRSAMDPAEATMLAELPPGRWVLLSTMGGRMMAASFRYQVEDLRRFGRLWWLPTNGFGNGLDDRAWAPILDINPGAAVPLLSALGAADVPAYTAPINTARAGADEQVFRLWVGSSKYSTAEQVLMRALPELDRRLGGRAVR